MISKGSAYDDVRPIPIVDESHYSRLLELALSARKSLPGLADRLLEEVERAEVKVSSEIPAGVVRIGSWVTYGDEGIGASNTIQLVYPDAADVNLRRISVLTPDGAALLGLSVGQSIEWEMNDGRRKKLTVLDVLQDQDSLLEA